MTKTNEQRFSSQIKLVQPQWLNTNRIKLVAQYNQVKPHKWKIRLSRRRNGRENYLTSCWWLGVTAPRIEGGQLVASPIGERNGGRQSALRCYTWVNNRQKGKDKNHYPIGDKGTAFGC